MLSPNAGSTFQVNFRQERITQHEAMFRQKKNHPNKRDMNIHERKRSSLHPEKLSVNGKGDFQVARFYRDS